MGIGVCGYGGGGGDDGDVVGGRDKEWEHHVGCEGCNSPDEEGEGSDTGAFLEEMVDLREGHAGIGFDDRLDVELGDPCREVEEETKPANPSEKLDFADFTSLGWKPPHRPEYAFEEGNHAAFICGRWSFFSRISFVDEDAADTYCSAESDTCNYAKNFELCVSEEPHVLG